ncbi:hypothetical protein MJO29_014132 [Puccinia striiformis f. sp. tritici]|nr:hypothetical protein MJO29_014132 [Puccinia striiformis f. sp. tritici]
MLEKLEDRLSDAIQNLTSIQHDTLRDNSSRMGVPLGGSPSPTRVMSRTSGPGEHKRRPHGLKSSPLPSIDKGLAVMLWADTTDKPNHPHRKRMLPSLVSYLTTGNLPHNPQDTLSSSNKDP